MLNKDKIRELAYLVKVDEVSPMNADRLECARVGGWNCVVGKNEFKAGDFAVYFEIDSKLPDKPPFSEMEFLRSKDFKIKSQKIRGVVSQGLLVPIAAFGWVKECGVVVEESGAQHRLDDESRFLTQRLEVTYSVAADNERKARPKSNVASFGARHPKLARMKVVKWLMRYDWTRKVILSIFGRKKADKKEWPVGKFPGVAKTDQERIENMTWVLNDKTPYVRTQKCDGSSGTFILEKKKFGRYEFYVCSRNVRMVDKDQDCFFKDENVYWSVAIKYDIEKKMREYLESHPGLKFICWQGEVCGPKIQGNPQKLKELKLFCFHWTDNRGRMDIRDAARVWKQLGMEVVPIDEELYVLPDDLEEFKLSADGMYDESCCGEPNCAREGYVYYKSTDPNFSFKNVSRKYLLKKGE